MSDPGDASYPLRLILQGWSYLIVIIGAGHAALGAALIIDGPDALRLTAFTAIPNWGWGAAALLSGAMIVSRSTKVAGLALTAVWYCLWSASRIVGAVEASGPFYVFVIYTFLAAVHILAAVIEWSISQHVRGKSGV